MDRGIHNLHMWATDIALNTICLESILMGAWTAQNCIYIKYNANEKSFVIHELGSVHQPSRLSIRLFKALQHMSISDGSECDHAWYLGALGSVDRQTHTVKSHEKLCKHYFSKVTILAITISTSDRSACVLDCLTLKTLWDLQSAINALGCNWISTIFLLVHAINCHIL